MKNTYTNSVLTLTEDKSINDALVLMKTNFVKRVVMTRSKKPAGIITERDINRFLESDHTKRSLSEISVREVMKKNLITVMADQPDFLQQCVARMTTFNIGSIIVTDEEGNLGGIITQTDITKIFAERHAGKYKVKDYMTRKVITCRNSDHLNYALKLLNKNNVSRLIVTDNSGILKGLVTTNTFLQRSDYFKNPNGATRDYLKHDSEMLVEDLTGKEILTVEPGNDLANAANLMITNKISGIPVVANDEVLGVITKFDIVRAFCDIPTHGDTLKEYRRPT
ncbi:MAG TPA: CBS domain-containing protein [Candidatus Nitrosotenuis sp.]|nr:CBS domain-containing protein [Candidatus Nitrosotenuis sp.]